MNTSILVASLAKTSPEEPKKKHLLIHDAKTIFFFTKEKKKKHLLISVAKTLFFTKELKKKGNHLLRIKKTTFVRSRAKTKKLQMFFSKLFWTLSYIQLSKVGKI